MLRPVQHNRRTQPFSRHSLVARHPCSLWVVASCPECISQKYPRRKNLQSTRSVILCGSWLQPRHKKSANEFLPFGGSFAELYAVRFFDVSPISHSGPVSDADLFPSLDRAPQLFPGLSFLRRGIFDRLFHRVPHRSFRPLRPGFISFVEQPVLHFIITCSLLRKFKTAMRALDRRRRRLKALGALSRFHNLSCRESLPVATDALTSYSTSQSRRADSLQTISACSTFHAEHVSFLRAALPALRVGGPAYFP